MSVKVVLALMQISSIILINVIQSKAQCNVCSSLNQLACDSETTYQFCVNNAPSGASSTCPTGYVCSTTSAIICVPNTGGAVATCGECNKCDPNLVFACTGIRTYALCLGQSTPSATVGGTCDATQVCNINSQQICATSTATLTASCPLGGTITTTTTTVATPTTATVPTYAQYFCSVMRINRRFQVPTEVDNSCRRYIYCLRTTAGIWSGQMYTCAGSTYFDPVSLYCVATRPQNC